MIIDKFVNVQIFTLLEFVQLDLQLQFEFLFEFYKLVFVLLNEMVDLFVEGGLVVLIQFDIFLIQFYNLN